MRVLLAGLLTGGLIAAGATPVQARPEPASSKAGTTLSARLAPPVVTVGEPAVLVATLTTKPAVRPVERPLVVQRRVDGAWTRLLELPDISAGRTVVPLDTTVAGTQVLRVVAPATNARAAVRSRQVT
ncbi:MAG: hypothetical protein WBP61_01680, partial [Nocardioides sp.]